MKCYKIKIGNMYLYEYYLDEDCIKNEFIKSIELHSTLYTAFINEEAQLLANKIFILTGAKCEVIEENETKDD